MEFLLQPNPRGDHLVLVPRTPYVSHQLYKAGPFDTYSTRIGKAEVSLNTLERYRVQRTDPTPLAEQESFFQTWLYFGFIAEFLGINIPDEELSVSEVPILSQDEIITWMYKSLIVEDGDEKFIKLDDAWFNSAQQISRAKFMKDPESKIRHFSQLTECLKIAHPLLRSLPPDFNHTVKYSIAALYELMTYFLRLIYLRFKIPISFGFDWSVGFLNVEAQATMRANGWCPSDIARAIVRFRTIQALNMIRMIDKNLPKRDHSKCTEMNCTSYQIDLSKYDIWHHDEGCHCQQLMVDSNTTTMILRREDKYPLLSLEEDLHDLKAKIIESNLDTSYIAISHVWADGLGNPKANSLYRCKLHHLRTLVSAISPSHLLWLDTLCCPAQNGHGKQLAIEKIRIVYARADHVLVLDAGLMAYTSSNLQSHELALRIFTSSWVRRLWTLQEGALAHSLYFQFADKAISLNSLRAEFEKISTHMPTEALRTDILNEIWRLDAFFHNDRTYATGNNIAVMDLALQFRGVSVASDEALCIATLLSLDLHRVLEVESQEDRMCVVWTIVAEKYGIPASVIFFEEARLETTGFRWALKSLLKIENGVRSPETRLVRWNDTQKGSLLPKQGLRVHYPGMRLRYQNEYTDGRPRNPWLGLPRVPENWIQFRDTRYEKWWRVVDCKYAALQNQWTDEQRREWNALELFTLHEVVEGGDAVLVLNEVGQGKEIQEGILGIEVESVEEGIRVTTKRAVMLQALGEEGYIYDVVEEVAVSLRDDPLTDRHVALLSELNPTSDPEILKALKENEAFKASVKALRDQMKEMVQEVIKKDKQFVQVVRKYWGEKSVDDIWVLVQDWWWHDFVGKQVGGGYDQDGNESIDGSEKKNEDGVWWIVD